MPGKGSLVAQGATNLAARDKAHDALAAGGTPSAVIALITRPEDDPDTLTGGLHYQQYAVVALNMDMPATFTGTSTFSWTGVMTAPHVSVQGNTLRGPEVVKNALEAFNNPPETDTPQLADRLMAALEAGARAGGDRRCAAELGALSVFIKVARPEDTEDRLTLDLVERSDKFYKPGLLRLFWQLWVRPETAEGRVNPLPNLRIAYERWHKNAMTKPAGNEKPVGPEHSWPVTPKYLNDRAGSIYAGTNEIQRNIMATCWGGGLEPECRSQRRTVEAEFSNSIQICPTPSRTIDAVLPIPP